MMLDYVKECFIEIFALINNEVKVSRNSTNRIDASIRCFRVKNFLRFFQHMKFCGQEEFGVFRTRNVHVVLYYRRRNMGSYLGMSEK
ncbi:hypothetical protein RhiirA4_407892 [Rhizophagus irregularis]|uniref:Uncharacterized protein n=1 Tax=Rhizophagus irregularis TaxID=588596 RepID=A0A2I1GZ84_9GLOM|nr:hypothetical protein RhiirA4_407892 [Rhizophagus irregularis]